ncbi:DUF4344 domain-containing metallopeptidase [Streptomyces sp. NPDC058486]|uniref:DUF4344 domain-containing metallopeptidase n=1 Tax=unclassified Streptomyces TaxID=2593676 RepID=UPI003646B8F5
MGAVLLAFLPHSGLPVAEASAPVALAETAADDVGFVSTYEEADAEDVDEQEFLEDRRLLEGVAKDLNRQLVIPATIKLTGTSCGHTDVGYIAKQSKIEVCYEYVAEVRDLFEKDGDENVAKKTSGVLTETLYHEAAHALIDKLKLPFTGLEEQVCDQFAAYQLIPQGATGQEALLASAENMTLMAPRPEKTDFSATHPPYPLRSAAYRSYLYGADPERWEHLVDGALLSRDRSAWSEEEYQHLRRGWSNVLKPHVETAEQGA